MGADNMGAGSRSHATYRRPSLDGFNHVYHITGTVSIILSECCVYNLLMTLCFDFFRILRAGSPSFIYILSYLSCSPLKYVSHL